MESNVRHLPRPPGTAQHDLPAEFHADSGRVVDLFDAAALIEFRGYSDRSLLSKYGYGSVFDLAGRLTATGAGRPDPVRTAAPETSPVNAAWLRTGLLISGAVLAALVQAQLGAGFLEMIVAGCAGWVLGQAVAGVTWYRLRSDSRAGAARYGGVVAVWCAAGAVVMAFSLGSTGDLGATGFSLVLGWVAYALSVSLLVVLDRVAVPLAVMVATVVVQLLVRLSTPQGTGASAATVLPALVAVAVIVGYTVYIVSSGEADGKRELTGYRGIAVPVTQAVLLSGSLVVALSLVPTSHGTAFVATAVLAVACTDPGIVLLRRRLSWFAHRSSSLSWSRRFAWGLACLAVLGTAVLAAGLVVFIVGATGAAPEQLGRTVLGSVLFTVLATLSSVLTAFGAQLKGLVPAALAVPVMLLVGTLGGGAALVFCALAFAVGLSLLIHEFSDARVFA